MEKQIRILLHIFRITSKRVKERTRENLHKKHICIIDEINKKVVHLALIVL